MLASDYLLKRYKSKEIQKKYFKMTDFLNDLTNCFIDLVDSKKEIYYTSVDTFKYYLKKYDIYVDLDVLNNLNNLYQKSKACHIDNFLFIGEILNDNNYKPNYSVYKEIDKLFFADNSPACFDLVLRSKDICRFKYPDGQSLIDKVLNYYKCSIDKNGDNSSFYRKVLFNMLSSDFYIKSDKKNDIIEKLDKFKKYYLNSHRKDSNYLDIERLINSLICLRDGLNSKNLKWLSNSYDIKKNFSSEIERAGSIPLLFHVSDMRDRNVITIDSERKVTRDDAISISMDGDYYILTLYISDVSSFVPINSSLFTHALQRGSSLYLNDKKLSNIPMFPIESQNFFSLDSGNDKYVMAHEFRFSNDFELVDFNVSRAVINVSKNYSYDDFNILSRFHSNDDNFDMISMLLDLSDGLIGNFKINIESKGMQIVSAFNLYLNSYMADYFNKNQYPFIYLNSFSFDGVDVLNCRLLPGFTSSYSNVSSGNIINYNKCYGYVTKPIRNFSSLLNQYFERFYFSGHSVEEVINFTNYWNCSLPQILYNLNKRNSLNNDYCDVISKSKVKK